jgi:hypothetical protein
MRKFPMPNLQAPKKPQASLLKEFFNRPVATWDVLFLWDLVMGSWAF